MIHFVTLAMALELHEDVIELGGSSGLRDSGLLDSALNMPRAQFGGEYLHPTIYEMAAAYGFHICKNHPFIDGNKRTAYAVMLLFLGMNDLTFTVNEQEHYAAMLAVANGEMTKQQLAEWLQKIAFKRP